MWHINQVFSGHICMKHVSSVSSLLVKGHIQIWSVLSLTAGQKTKQLVYLHPLPDYTVQSGINVVFTQH